MNRFVLCLVGALVSVAPAASFAQLPTGKQNCEVSLDADKVSDDQKAGQMTASGNAIVTQCDMKLHADAIVYDRKSQKINATGHILVVSERAGVVSGDAGIYDMTKKLVTLTGRVVLKQGKNVLSGTHATYNVTTGIAQVDAGNPNGTQTGATTNGGRVHAILSPPPAKGN
jgi:lipopolysaccharide export system protein LptA